MCGSDSDIPVSIDIFVKIWFSGEQYVYFVADKAITDTDYTQVRM